MTKYVTPHITKGEIEEILGKVVPIRISANKLFLYQRAFVHCSVPNDAKGIPDACEYLLESNERLEYLGDAYLACAVSNYLYHRYPDVDEGELTKYCSRIVCGTQCSRLAKAIGMKGRMLMSEQTENMKGMDNTRFLEDAFEALVGAIGLDHGYAKVEEFMFALIEKYLDEENDILRDRNYKDALLRHTQKKKMTTPEYITLHETGRPNEKEFTVVVKVYGRRCGRGRGSKVRTAQQMAAKDAIDRLGLDMSNANS